MVVQSEAQLEAALVRRLTGLGWMPVVISDASAMRSNLKAQIEAHNGLDLTDGEFRRVLAHLDKGGVFERAQILRDRMQLTRDDGTAVYIQFFNAQEWCRNRYQVTTQVIQDGAYRTRYDVTLLVNGLPLVQIELKRRGMELKEAFNQINRYHRHSFWAESGLFQYVQIFVISNGVNTRYFANNRHQDFKQTFYWAGEDNTPITKLDAFADAFLEKCHASKMIAKYTVLHQSDRVLMVLRPYQYHAVEAIQDRVRNGRKNGYIWHTTGSGKTLTSFKASQVLLDNPKVAKVVFVVDRADLDYQTTKEFNFFAEGSVDGTDDTKALVRQLSDGTRLIVTTIQKLNGAITRDRHSAALQAIKDERIVFVFDECHRSQFGQTHKNIGAFFSKAQMFGFTGTPIFADNAVGRRTTKDLFEDCLHRYVITDAIRDENVLRFSVEYWGKLTRRGEDIPDEEVAGLNLKEFYESRDRIEGVVDWIIENHDRKTHGRKFAAMLCVGSVEALTRYYDAFRTKREAGKHDLRVATIFTFAANEDDADADGLIPDPDLTGEATTAAARHSRDVLSGYVEDYNRTFGTGHSVKDSKAFYAYYKALAKRMKARDRKPFVPEEGIDILLVVNMFLTGFDVKTLNTLYVDKNLRYHGLIQAYSRTNRIIGQMKSHGNIVCFRNLKPKTDEAIALFSNREARETILMGPYEDYVAQFNAAALDLMKIAATPGAVDRLESEDDILAFVQAFRTLLRIRNVLATFAEFSPDDLMIEPQRFEDYKSKYLDIYDRTKADQERDAPASIIGEVDFELELIRRDEINVAYILALLGQISKAETEDDGLTPAGTDARVKSVLDMLSADPKLRSKRELIEEFVASFLPRGNGAEATRDAFISFWDRKRVERFEQICSEEKLDPERFGALIEAYQFSSKAPLRDDVAGALVTPPSILDRRKIADRILAQMIDFVETFDENVGDLEAA